MVLKFKKKKAQPQVVSNETKTLPEKPVSAAPQAPTASSSGVPIPTPFIDRISVIAVPPSTEAAKLIYKMINPVHNSEASIYHATKTTGFNRAFRIGPWSPVAIAKKKWPLLQYACTDQIVTKVRIEFSPADIMGYEFIHLHDVLLGLVPGGWEFFINHGLVSMIEVTADFPDVAMADVNILPQQTTTAKTWGNGGELQTLVLGKPSGNQLRVYNRGAKRKAQGKTASKYQGTRIERRLKLNGNLALRDLSKLPNPFKSMSIVALPPKEPAGEKKPYIWHMFRDSVELRTLPVALKLLPVERRTMYRKWLAAHPSPWWNADAIWSKWPEYLSDHGIVDPEYFKD